MAELKASLTLALSMISVSTIISGIYIIRRHNKKMVQLEKLTDDLILQLNEFQSNIDQWVYDARFSEIIEDFDEE